MKKQNFLPRTLKPSQQSAVVKMLAVEESNRIRDKVIQTSISTVTSAFLVVLHDKHGFSKRKLNNLMKQVTVKMQDVKDKFTTIDDYIQWCKEYGIEDF